MLENEKYANILDQLFSFIPFFTSSKFIDVIIFKSDSN